MYIYQIVDEIKTTGCWENVELFLIGRMDCKNTLSPILPPHITESNTNNANDVTKLAFIPPSLDLDVNKNDDV